MLIINRFGRLCLLAIPVVYGCASSRSAVEPVTPYVTLLTSGTSFATGSPLLVVIVNHSEFSLTYNHCFLQLDLLTNDGWRNVSDENRNCVDALHPVASESQDTVVFGIPSDALPGTYRVRFDRTYVSVQSSGQQKLVPAEQLTSNVFAVR